MKTEDSEVTPFITQKDVILCRSGIQIYSYAEVVAALGEPPVKKDFYKEYRPASVVVKAKDLFKSLPVCCEHPSEWITSKNFKELAGGTLDKEIEVVALEGESEGEIGLKSNITFYTDELYNYYLNNKEVSVGYTCKKHYVENPDEVGYDILLDEITEVNHLAITRAGRGGSSVAVIDSIIGGLRPMRTGIFAYLASKMQKDSKERFSFGKEVLNAVKNSKGTTEEELASEMKGVLDSMSVLKDCEAKDTLLDVVKDCFDNKEKALANEGELTATLDSMWIDIHGDSLKEIAKAFAKLSETKSETSVPANDTDSQNKDSEPEKKDEGKEGENKDAEPEKKDEGKEGESKDAEPKKDEKDGCNNKDSAVMTKDDMLAVIKDALPELVQSAVKEVLGLKDDTAKPQVDGGVVDSSNTGSSVVARNYEDFL